MNGGKNASEDVCIDHEVEALPYFVSNLGRDSCFPMILGLRLTTGGPRVSVNLLGGSAALARVGGKVVQYIERQDELTDDLAAEER